VSALNEDGGVTVECIEKFKGADFTNFEDVMVHYLSLQGDTQISAACVAIAGPVTGDVVEMTNLPWSLSQRDLQQKFGLESFSAINDYTALALSVTGLREKDLAPIKKGLKNAQGNRAVLGPGTGLGVAGLAYSPSGWVAISSQGGHVNLPAVDSFEQELLAILSTGGDYVSAETCLSGNGLVNLYKAVAVSFGRVAEPYSAADISALAMQKNDELCIKALDTFCAMLGSVASNVAMTYDARGGVYITGGIIPRFVDYFKESRFIERFCNKGPMSDYVEAMSVDVVIHDTPALMGGAEFLKAV
jgi:glucokinase